MNFLLLTSILSAFACVDAAAFGGIHRGNRHQSSTTSTSAAAVATSIAGIDVESISLGNFYQVIDEMVNQNGGDILDEAWSLIGKAEHEIWNNFDQAVKDIESAADLIFNHKTLTTKLLKTTSSSISITSTSSSSSSSTSSSLSITASPTISNATTNGSYVTDFSDLASIYSSLSLFNAVPIIEQLGLALTATVEPASSIAPFNDSPAPTPLNDKASALTFVQNFWNAFLNPNDKEEAKTIASKYFTWDCKGRITVTRDFEGSELNTEYIFGLFSDINPVLFRMIGVAKSSELQNFIFDDNKVVSTVTAEFLVEPFNYTIPVQIDMFMLLDGTTGNYSIAEYDASFRNFVRIYGLVGDYTKAVLGQAFGASGFTGDQIFFDMAIESICLAHEAYCTGDNRQYDSMADCLTFLKTVRIGESFEGGRNTIFCRNIHQVMLPYRPSVHCPHIGPTGGEMCRDSDTDYFTVVNSYDTYFPTLFYSS